ncbi:thiamine-phosphate kinase [Rhodohalobacter sp. SW132]|uniref:thiamine-phosphate kinase n=1 Tax=Rhodohalobacter sp. SW132 TaxID=2293433 RepID=UPI000E25C52D|nr:thiamine-phosphate kinase [Rhodohalobacter sp. SW132]REL33571.1 thiamine-phosphate kinase [Rhodohalobacter sp. SW132]
MKKNDFKTIQEIGFARFVERLSKFTGSVSKETELGMGDDASLFNVQEGCQITTSSEIFLEGVHFDLTYTPFKHLGYKIVTAAVSDIYAMNGQPKTININLAVPNRYSVQMMEQLYEGIDAACKDYGVQITGGDTTASHQILVVSVSVTGEVEKGSAVKRSDAEEDNIICVTGELGAAMAGLRILLREKKTWQESGSDHFQPDLEKYEFVVQRQLVPKARFDLIESFKNTGIRPTSMTDVTKGVVNDLQNIARSSNMGVQMYSPAVPISFEVRNVADEMQEDVDKYAFYGGEDFEMLFTLKEEDVEKLKTEFEDFAVIGKIVGREKQFVINTGEEETIKFDLFET